MRRRNFIKAAFAGLCGIGLVKKPTPAELFADVAKRNTVNAGELMKVVSADGCSGTVIRGWVASYDVNLPGGSVEHRAARSDAGIINIIC